MYGSTAGPRSSSNEVAKTFHASRSCNSDSLASAIARLPQGWDGNGMATWARISVARLQRRPADVLRALDAAAQPLSEDDLVYMPHSLLLGMPAGREVSVPLLRVEPGFDPLRQDPRFEEMLRRHEKSGDR